MAVATDGTLIGSIGGGAAEGKCLDQCEVVLREQHARLLEIDLRGKPGAIRDGICGGTMRLLLTPLSTSDTDTVTHIAQMLRSGQRLVVHTSLEKPHLRVESPSSSSAGIDDWAERLHPDPALLIVGAGHIGRVLAHRATEVGLQCLVQDERPEWLDPNAFPAASRLSMDWPALLEEFLAWQGPAYVALVTRGFKQDVTALADLAPHFDSLDYLGVLGSEHRIDTVRDLCAARGLPVWPSSITHAPVGIPIGAETPEEIAISILAEIIATRRRDS
ncbi:putative xanthine dehydrogenase subunit A [Planctomycetes bacterium Pan216]|uniref:Putative xanthine dehydrogenase subunit A n=2 Tax=Kolteria novifilia TaxID=2527975 RepID=A0A518AX28_9BACT|nr:putative xanthine dehydrogenase subunit A [Planctomycetes bacterium Pan216]